ncbi:hypothetical protein ABBQ38_015172 [Trebouxia sp. C0009 RCD-2024]
MAVGLAEGVEGWVGEMQVAPGEGRVEVGVGVTEMVAMEVEVGVGLMKEAQGVGDWVGEGVDWVVVVTVGEAQVG